MTIPSLRMPITKAPRMAPSCQRGSSKHCSCNGIHLIRLPGCRVCRNKFRTDDEPYQGCTTTADHIHQGIYLLYLDARQPSRVFVSTYSKHIEDKSWSWRPDPWDIRWLHWYHSLLAGHWLQYVLYTCKRRQYHVCTDFPCSPDLRGSTQTSLESLQKLKKRSPSHL